MLTLAEELLLLSHDEKTGHFHNIDNAMTAEPGTHNTGDCVDFLRHHGPEIHEAALERLIQRGILRRDESRVLWAFGARGYPMIESDEQQEVKQRIVALLTSDEIPDARDVVIVALAQSCGLLERIFSPDELARLQARIDQIVRLDLIGRAVRAAIEHLRAQTVGLAGYPS
jgi:hypothetical protein